MDFNEQQVALFTWANQESGSCNLIARAGTGKTTTIIELAKRISGNVFLGRVQQGHRGRTQDPDQ